MQRAVEAELGRQDREEIERSTNEPGYAGGSASLLEVKREFGIE